MKQELADKLLDVLNEYKTLGITEQIDYQKFYLYSIITHSTAIEGSTVTEVENQLLFDEGITSNKRTMMEQMMNLDLKAAYEFGMQWIKRHAPITVEWLIILASKVMARTGSEYHSMVGDFSAARGELRKLNVTAGIGGESYMSYQKVPTKVLKEDKAEYIQALKDSREDENVDVFIDCMARLHVQHLQSDIDQFVKSTTVKVVDKDVVTTEMIVGQFGFAATSAKRYLRQLAEFGYLTAQGGNKNRTYKKIN